MKRKPEGQIPNDTSKKRKRQKSAQAQSSTAPKEASTWPVYFEELFKIFKAINTVLGFVSSRKQLATTFQVIQSSVEALLNQPLELTKVAELKALLPDLINFSYIPRNELRVSDGSSLAHGGNTREPSPDYSAFSNALQSRYPPEDQDEQVLILEFVDNARGKKTKHNSLLAVPTLQPSSVKKLIEKRNVRFRQVTDDFLASISRAQDPVHILQAAAEAHVPADAFDASSSKTPRAKYTSIPNPGDRPTIDAIVSELEEQPWCTSRIVERRTFDAKEGRTAILDPPLSESILQALKGFKKISQLYTHQVSAIHAITRGKHVVVSTSTASGKSLIYQIPVLRFLEDNPYATAIFVYPTKALAQDQKLAMDQLVLACPGLEHIKAANYDGDTPQELRSVIRETASVIFTNFDMIHASILPHEDKWRRFLKNLKLFAADELHYYTGLLGSHVAQIMRRLRRVCAAVENRHTLFVSCSATMSNPKLHMAKLFGIFIQDVEAITDDGAPYGRKDFLVWNPPFIDEQVPSLGRYSSISEATRLMRFLMIRGARVILFCKIRKVCELAMRTIRADLSSEGRYDILEKTMPYRGGYSREARRQIEQDAFNGRLLGIVATNALELGVDIGTLDAVIILGFPGSVASFKQQAGRAGRRSRDSLAVLVADPLPIDQHYVKHPEELFETFNDDLIVDLENRPLLEAHLQCAAYEMPLSTEDGEYFGPLFHDVCESHLLKDKDGWYHTHPKFLPYPSKYISIRGAQEEKYTVVNVTKAAQSGGNGSILEEVEISRAMFEVYEGGVFMHRGLTFIVKEVSHYAKFVEVIRADVNWITSPRDFTNVDAVRTYRIKEIQDSPYHTYYGKIDVEVKVFGFFKIRNGVILEAVDLDTPAWERDTTGLWMDVPQSLLQLFRNKGINPAEAIHAAEHAFLNHFSLSQDIKTECKASEKEYATVESRRKRPARLIFYDAIDKGGGVTAKAFDNVSQLLLKAHNAIEACDCEEGCSRCVQSTACKEGNLVSSKLGAHLILKCLLGFEIHEDGLPSQDATSIVDTIVEAHAVQAIGGVQVEASDILGKI